MAQDICGDRIISQVILKSQKSIGIDCIYAVLLESVGSNFIPESNASAFLPQINNDPLTVLLNPFQSTVKLRFAIAFQRTEHLPCETFRVNTNRKSLRLINLTGDDGQMLNLTVAKYVDGEITIAGGKPRLRIMRNA